MIYFSISYKLYACVSSEDGCTRLGFLSADISLCVPVRLEEGCRNAEVYCHLSSRTWSTAERDRGQETRDEITSCLDTTSRQSLRAQVKVSKK